MIEAGNEKTNYLCAKFSLDNLKKDKEKIIHNPNCFRGCRLTFECKDVGEKFYFDTPDEFFTKVGITININRVKGWPTQELVVRYSSDRPRIEFLQGIPDTFAKNIPNNSSIKDNLEFITQAILELIPNGISVDIPKYLKSLVVVAEIHKKREVYDMLNISGLKILLAFTEATFANILTKKSMKEIILELESYSNRRAEFDGFVKTLRFEFPTLIELPSSDRIIVSNLK